MAKSPYYHEQIPQAGPGGKLFAPWSALARPAAHRPGRRVAYGIGVTVFLAYLSSAAFVESAATAFHARNAVGAADRSAVAAHRSATAIESGDRRERMQRLLIFAQSIGRPALAIRALLEATG